jgi:hypothetical protein
MRITCDRCGKDRMLNEAHMKRSDVPIRDIIARMRHDGCGGAAKQNIGQATAVDLVSIANQETPGLVGDTGDRSPTMVGCLI